LLSGRQTEDYDLHTHTHTHTQYCKSLKMNLL